ncbi:MAG: cyclic pyranopterin monophosphate synthase MoaC [Thermodesulfovibrionales bacterium]|nr:cyclic pyranopterin monophosphate synthase MoaC [Thermodesulfovibrionales bacterium]
MKLTHVDDKGNARMGDVSGKEVTLREARATARIKLSSETIALLLDKAIPKGDVLTVAKIAGIMAAKKTHELIPMCHPLNISHVDIEFNILKESSEIEIESIVKVEARTGVEMEALCAAATAALTIYDMCKAVDREMVITDIMLIEKKGGRSGEYKRGDKR